MITDSKHIVTINVSMYHAHDSTWVCCQPCAGSALLPAPIDGQIPGSRLQDGTLGLQGCVAGALRLGRPAFHPRLLAQHVDEAADRGHTHSGLIPLFH